MIKNLSDQKTDNVHTVLSNAVVDLLCMSLTRAKQLAVIPDTAKAIGLAAKG